MKITQGTVEYSLLEALLQHYTEQEIKDAVETMRKIDVNDLKYKKYVHENK